MNPAYEPSPNMPQQIYPASIPASNGHAYQHTPYAHPSQQPQHHQPQNHSQHPHPHQLLTSSSHHSHQAPPPHHYQQVIETHPLQHHPQHQHTHVVQPPPQPVGSHHARLDSTSNVAGMQASVVTTASPMAPISRVDETTRRKYQLDVVQQPRRARMCGFGDKDRRPVTPPPCVRLVIIDIDTGKEIDYNEIDCAMFVLNVDLWNESGTQEVNLVRPAKENSTASPPVVAFPYGQFNGADQPPMQFPSQMIASRDPTYGQPHQMGFPSEYRAPVPGYGPSPHQYAQNAAYMAPQQYYGQPQPFRQDLAMQPQGHPSPYGPRYGSAFPSPYMQEPAPSGRGGANGNQPSGMFTRNLIGSLAASAFRLNDDDGRVGIWFILQDLSVRTEGLFRLRFSFVDVSCRNSTNQEGNSPKINTSRAPIMTANFSEPFTVFSAKKFPGVCESTPLSKTFAAQGIKIPIRKDNAAKGDDDDDFAE